MISGYLGGGWDSTLSRIGDIFFAIPLLLGAIIFLSSLPEFFNDNYFLIVLKVVLALAFLGWPSLARLMRSSVIQVKPNDYVQAARALGASPPDHPLARPPQLAGPGHRRRDDLPRAATSPSRRPCPSSASACSRPPSRGASTSASAIVGLRTTPHMLFFPSVFLSLAGAGVHPHGRRGA